MRNCIGLIRFASAEEISLLLLIYPGNYESTQRFASRYDRNYVNIKIILHWRLRLSIPKASRNRIFRVIDRVHACVHACMRARARSERTSLWFNRRFVLPGTVTTVLSHLRLDLRRSKRARMDITCRTDEARTKLRDLKMTYRPCVYRVRETTEETTGLIVRERRSRHSPLLSSSFERTLLARRDHIAVYANDARIINRPGMITSTERRESRNGRFHPPSRLLRLSLASWKSSSRCGKSDSHGSPRTNAVRLVRRARPAFHWEPPHSRGRVPSLFKADNDSHWLREKCRGSRVAPFRFLTSRIFVTVSLWN